MKRIYIARKNQIVIIPIIAIIWESGKTFFTFAWLNTLCWILISDNEAAGQKGDNNDPNNM